jgi:hypothetical protein
VGITRSKVILSEEIWLPLTSVLLGPMGLTIPGKEPHVISRSWRPTQMAYSWAIPMPLWLWMSFQTGSVWPRVHLNAKKREAIWHNHWESPMNSKLL